MGRPLTLRDLKDRALRAFEARRYREAARLFVETAALEPGDPLWRVRAGEAFRKLGLLSSAAASFAQAAAGYARNGFPLQAGAMRRLALSLDPTSASLAVP
jgi:hypothetical protein